jgi:hypothetical protein
LIGKNNEQIKKSLLKIWEEVCLLEEKENIDLKENPEDTVEKKKQRFFKKIFGETNERCRQVAFVHDKNPVTSGWTYGHELGRLYIQKVFDGMVTTHVYDDSMEKNPEEILLKAIEAGNDIIFTTSAKISRFPFSAMGPTMPRASIASRSSAARL